MKRWFKLAACVMAAALVLPMTAYADEADPRAVFDEGIAKYNELKDLDCTTNILISLENLSALDTNVVINLKRKDAGTPQLQYMMNMSINMFGVTQSSSAMYHDGYCYLDSSDEKVKAPFSPDEFMALMSDSPENMRVTSADFSEVAMRTEGDNRVISFTIDPDRLNAYVNSLTSDSDSEDASNMQTIVQAASGECTINSDGCCIDMKVGMICDVTEDGFTMTMHIDAAQVVNNPGQPVEITYPDTSDYQDIAA